MDKKEIKENVSTMMEFLIYICSEELFKPFMKPCYYLPAAKSGILQGHKALAASIIKTAPYVGIEERREIRKFSGIVSDFISSILNLTNEKGPFYKLAQQLENEIIAGEISVKTKDKFRYPEIHYNFLNKKIPLHRTSSTVSEFLH